MKTLLRSAARGFLWGILAHYLFTLGISLILRLGYYAPCRVSMGERFGGDLGRGAARTTCGLAGSLPPLGNGPCGSPVWCGSLPVA